MTLNRIPKTESREEDAFYAWTIAAAGKEMIRIVRRAETQYTLANPATIQANTWTGKTRISNSKKITWLKRIRYTPDFSLVMDWDFLDKINDALYGIHRKPCQLWIPCECDWRRNEVTVLVDVKGGTNRTGGRVRSERRRFRHVQAQMLQQQEIHVNRVDIEHLFKATFYPIHELYVRKDRTPRKGFTRKQIGAYAALKFKDSRTAENIRIQLDRDALIKMCGAPE